MQIRDHGDVPIEILDTGQAVERWVAPGTAARIVGCCRDHLARLRRRGVLGPDAVQVVGLGRYRYLVSGVRRALSARHG
jgi:hypothetical protein